MIFTVVGWHDSGSAWLVVGGLLYVVSTFLVTIVFNVPLNDALAAIDPDNAGASLCGTTISRAGRRGTTSGQSVHLPRPHHSRLRYFSCEDLFSERQTRLISILSYDRRLRLEVCSDSLGESVREIWLCKERVLLFALEVGANQFSAVAAGKDHLEIGLIHNERVCQFPARDGLTHDDRTQYNHHLLA